MPFDKSLDVKIFSQEHDFEGTRVSVGVYQYSQGEKKVQITRQNVNKQGELGFTKLGRLRKEEAEAIIPSLQKAIEFM